jgi:hypothetical protein
LFFNLAVIITAVIITAVIIRKDMYFNAKKQNKTNYISLKNKAFENIVGEKIYSRCSPDESLRMSYIPGMKIP